MKLERSACARGSVSCVGINDVTGERVLECLWGGWVCHGDWFSFFEQRRRQRGAQTSGRLVLRHLRSEDAVQQQFFEGPFGKFVEVMVLFKGTDHPKIILEALCWYKPVWLCLFWGTERVNFRPLASIEWKQMRTGLSRGKMLKNRKENIIKVVNIYDRSNVVFWHTKLCVKNRLFWNGLQKLLWCFVVSVESDSRRNDQNKMCWQCETKSYSFVMKSVQVTLTHWTQSSHKKSSFYILFHF